MFLTPLSSHVTDNHQPSMDAYMESELETFVLLQPLIQVSHGIENTEPSTDSSLSIVFMRLGIAEINEQTIPE